MLNFPSPNEYCREEFEKSEENLLLLLENMHDEMVPEEIPSNLKKSYEIYEYFFIIIYF
jgi:hypothetical protein